MNSKTTGVISYITIIGFIVAYVAGDKEGAKFHLNQALVVGIIEVIGYIVGIIPVVGSLLGWIIGIIWLIYAVLGIVYAVKGEDKALPVIGGISLLK